MNKKIGEKIRSIRASKGYSQANIAEDLGITSGAFAKIERGETDANVSRLLRIAEVLEVNICEFFEESYSSKAMEEKRPYGFATKDEVETLNKDMKSLLREFEKLRAELLAQKKVSAKKKKK